MSSWAMVRSLNQNYEFNGENIDKNKRWLDWFKLSSKLFEDWLKFNYSEWKSTILYLLERIDEDEAIIIELHDLKNLIHKIHIWKFSEISTFLPAILCPTIKSNTKWFKQTETLKLIEYIKEQLDEFSAIFITKRDEIEVHSTMNSVYSFEFNFRLFLNDKQAQLETLKAWPVINWCWKPTKLLMKFYRSGLGKLKEFRKLPYIVNIKSLKIEEAIYKPK